MIEELKFEDRSITKIVAELKWHMVIIEKDFNNVWKWKFSIFKDTPGALGWELILEKWKIDSLVEAKKRASSNFYTKLGKNI